MNDNQPELNTNKSFGTAIKEEFIRSLQPPPVEVIRSRQVGLVGLFSLLMGCLGILVSGMCIMNDHAFAGVALGTASVAGTVYIVTLCLREKRND